MQIDPVVLFFLLGLAAGWAKSDLKLPSALYDTLSVFLLLAIGIKGGLELAKQPVLQILPQALLVLLMGFLIPLLIYPLLRWRLPQVDAASIAAHYGSVSVVTYAVGVAYLTRQGVSFESQTTLFLVLLEMPALIVGVVLARLGAARAAGEGDGTAVAGHGWGKLLHEVLLGKSMVLLLGGLAIGALAGPDGIKPLDRLYLDLFKPVLTLFLLEMGLVVAGKLGILRKQGFFLVGIGVGLPLALSWVGIGFGVLMGLSPGGVTMLGVLAASASYIAAPAAMRMAVPQANPALSLGAALGITFPFNLLVGIPLYHQFATAVTGG
ncbi:sodium-dependent bicarbonate transport family permease [Chitinilyticum piscinae]|uniref:Sodium-dependent bicarbonate transport family permease n=1 Tax=Chitinilyticum piscinae TaxID=2866724 RepID=A0A8J7FKD9_9NEIS|nr:sodium-dependent bicarbonate transport family permease [Chitinilyticum piscinae]MBE9609255.1 sodium-dependent bicarbonate transport family permease [Chitinilyticum piscinae]